MDSTERIPKKGRRRWLRKWLGIVFIVFVATAIFVVRYAIGHAELILRARVIQAVSHRFNSKVELAGFQVSLLHGIEVSGTGLEVYGSKDPNAYQPGIQSLIQIREFRFQTTLRSLYRSPMHIDTVYLNRKVLNVPQAQTRQVMNRIGP